MSMSTDEFWNGDGCNERRELALDIMDFGDSFTRTGPSVTGPLRERECPFHQREGHMIAAFPHANYFHKFACEDSDQHTLLDCWREINKNNGKPFDDDATALHALQNEIEQRQA